MATRILDLDLAEPLPPEIRLDGADRLWLVVWSAGAPVGATMIAAAPGSDTIPGETIAAAAAAFRDVQPAPPPPPAGRLPTLSVVVCTRDRAELLPIVLDALAAQSTDDFELVIVDNAPRDARTRHVVSRRAPHARYVVEPVPGLPRARNAGIRAARGDVVAFTDDDCRPVPGWVEAIRRAFARMPHVGCLTGPILPLELETPAQEAMEARGGFNRGFRPTVFAPEPTEGPVYPVQAWKFGAGGNMALTRRCLDTLGGFDEALWRSEDLDIFYRTLRAGFSIAFEPGAAVRHRHLRTWRELARRLFHWGWGYATFLDKIARADTPEFAARAREERRNWLRYQIRDRAIPALRRGADLPLPLILLEIAGGFAGFGAYPRARRTAVGRARRLPAESAAAGLSE